MTAADLVFGVDVGGSRTKSVALTLDGQVAATATMPTPARPGRSVVDHVVLAVGELRARLPGRRPAVVGVVVPGLVDDLSGVAMWSANLGWRDLDLRGLLQESLPTPVVVGQDVRAGLIGEVRFGAGRGEQDVLFVPLGTGIAGALLCGGKVTAASEWAGEIGHVTVDPAGPECGCGRRGCLEAIASAGALGRRWGASGCEGDAATVAAAVTTGDPLAARLWSEAVAALVQVVAPVAAACGTRVLLLGGGLVNAGSLLLDPVDSALRSALGHDRCVVRSAQLGDRAGALGAAAMALDLLER